jgi:hypothetical protein
MTAKRILTRVAIATVLASGLAGAAAAAQPHAHNHGAAPTVVQRDDGKPWPTDTPLRTGMTEIRNAIAAALDRIHHGAFAPADFQALAAQLDQQIEYVTVNCRLPEDADAALHVVLGEIIDGIETMRGGPDRDGGAVQVVKALDLYAGAFDHAGWIPLTH